MISIQMISTQFRTNIDSAHNSPLKSGSAESDVKRILVTDWSAGIQIQKSPATAEGRRHSLITTNTRTTQIISASIQQKTNIPEYESQTHICLNQNNTMDFDKIYLIWVNCVKLALNYEISQFIRNAFLVSNLSIQKAIFSNEFPFRILLKCIHPGLYVSSNLISKYSQGHK